MVTTKLNGLLLLWVLNHLPKANLSMKAKSNKSAWLRKLSALKDGRRRGVVNGTD